MPELRVQHIEVPLGSSESLRVPYWELLSGVEGPAFMLIAAQHGNEVQGIEVIRRLVEIARTDLQRGSVLAVPFGNPVAIRKRRPHISSGPERPYGDADGHNMNLTWPGDPEGNDSQRISAAIHDAVCVRATHCLDIHCWNKFTTPTALPRQDYQPSLELARIGALPFVAPRQRSQNPISRDHPNTIGALFNDSGRAGLSVELAGQYLVDLDQVAMGLRCAVNIACHLGLLPGEPDILAEPQVWLDKAAQHEVLAPVNGLWVQASVKLCDFVDEGQLLGHVLAEDSLGTIPVTAPVAGRLSVLGCPREDCDVSLAAQHPYVTAGEIVAKVAAPGG
ncbi:MAG: succinylglutamate desuccinylase/aspartoacylase family protein [Armatimonadetes bacterium]|nr:succinylglutamate desuccinylase/aspartoacylase family protein [Armatimonadota bacterium]MDI9587168.1 succinylglutamate desuccinylase/aspartoacylase family protein [Acidobacteriota bacterium]